MGGWVGEGEKGGWNELLLESMGGWEGMGLTACAEETLVFLDDCFGWACFWWVGGWVGGWVDELTNSKQLRMS